jgi:O-antigen/teichoic acid export membrane protein
VSLLSRILRVGTIAQSMSVYLPAMIVQKALGMGRVILFTYLVSREQMGIWSSGVLFFILGAPLVSLGANHAMARYVSTYEARGQLVEFYRRSRVYVLLTVVVVTGICVLGWEFIQPVLERVGMASDLHVLRDANIRLAVVGNLVLMALYLAQVSFMYGLRAYTLVSIMEVSFSVVFTVWGVAWVLVAPGALALLLAHMISLAIVMIAFLWLLGGAVKRIAQQQADGEEIQTDVEIEPTPSAEGDAMSTTISLDAAKQPPDALATTNIRWLRIGRYGLAGMIGTLIWQCSQYLSYFMVLHRYREISAGSFWVMMQFTQPLVFVANAAWAVLFSHVARRWEGGDRRGAMFMLETSYKAVALTIITFSVLLYTTSHWWIYILAPKYRHGFHYISGLLTFFLTISNLTMLAIPARLHERPIVIAIGATAGAIANGVLAALWMPAWGEVGAARAAGVGMFFGGGLVMLVYLLVSKTRFSDGTYFVLGTPVLLLLPTYIIGPLWAVILPVCVFSPWVFDAKQKRVLASTLRNGMDSLKRTLPWKRSP